MTNATLLAGRALDAEIAEQVMGWRWTMDECEAPSLNDGRCVRSDGVIVSDFRPSRSIAAAWLVVEYMTNWNGGGYFYLQLAHSDDGWAAQFYLWGASEPCQTPWATADTPEMAICQAALLHFTAGAGR